MKRRQWNLRRVLLSVAVYLVAGAVTTVAVAWGFVLRGHGEFAEGRSLAGGWIDLDDDDRRLAAISISERGKAGSRLINIYVWSWATVDDSVLDVDERYQPSAVLPFRSVIEHVRRTLADRFGKRNQWIMLEARGWPMCALWCAPTDPTPGVTREDSMTSGVMLSETTTYGTPPRAPTLPLRPVWRGFLLDTFFYAVVWLAMVSGVYVLRRGVRRWRGRCPMCGYQLHGGGQRSGCSECGWGRE